MHFLGFPFLNMRSVSVNDYEYEAGVISIQILN